MMAALLVAMAVMMIAMTAALPAWQTAAKREKEAELIFRGKQYARALSGFQRKYANAYPPNVDVLINERFLRKKYKDPITNDDFVFVPQGGALPTTTTSPFGAGSTTPGGLSGSSTLQTGASRGAGAGTTALSSQTSQIGRGMTLGTSSTSQNTQAGRAAGSTNIGGGTSTGIVAVYSKSKEKSLRVYNGYDHYNEWVFVGTAATQTVTSPTGGQTPGSGTRGGAAGTRGGQPTGRGGQQGGRGGLQPPPPPPPPPPGGRGGGPGGGNPFGGAGGFPGRGGR